MSLALHLCSVVSQGIFFVFKYRRITESVITLLYSGFLFIVYVFPAAVCCASDRMEVYKFR